LSSSVDWTTQLRRGVLELGILKLLRAQPSYGYELIGRLEKLGPLGAGENTVYPLLRRLRRDGLLDIAAVESPAGPPRQVYRLSASGNERLAALEQEWKSVVEAIRTIPEGD
jgi:PadR family transcriptional regulator, regulatory protein PadR